MDCVGTRRDCAIGTVAAKSVAHYLNITKKFKNLYSQKSIKTASAAHDKGFDEGKKIKGRKQHMVVDTVG